ACSTLRRYASLSPVTASRGPNAIAPGSGCLGSINTRRGSVICAWALAAYGGRAAPHGPARDGAAVLEIPERRKRRVHFGFRGQRRSAAVGRHFTLHAASLRQGRAAAAARPHSRTRARPAHER